MGEKTLVILDPTLRRGFTSVPNKVLFAPGLSMAAKCLYSILLAFAWQEDECFPGQERLAEAAGCTDRTVRKYLEELKEFGMVSWMQRGLNQTNIYYIHDLNKIETLKPLSRKDRKERSGPDRKGFSVQDRKELSDIRILSNNNVVVEDCQDNISSIEATTTTNNPEPKPELEKEPEPDNAIREIRELALRNCNAELSKKFVSGLMKEFSPERIKEKIGLIGTGTGQIRNLPGLLLSALREDYVNVPGKPSQSVNKEGGRNNKETARAGPEKGYDDLEWYPLDQRNGIMEKKRELIRQLYMS